MVAPGGHAWLLPGGAWRKGACVAKGGMHGEGGVHGERGAVHGERGGMRGKGGACMVKGGMHGMHPPTPKIRPVIARAVCILLECILVLTCFCFGINCLKIIMKCSFDSIEHLQFLSY